MVPRIALCIAAVTLAIIMAIIPGPPKTAGATVIAFPSATTPATPVATGASFGASCTRDADCASKACSKGRQGSFCSSRCSSDADCPSPPGIGACNGRGFCKKSEDKGKGKGSS